MWRSTIGRVSRPVEMWFDFASPYSYLAAERAPIAAGEAGVRLVLRPFLLGPIFQATLGFSDSPFNRNDPRGRYMWRDLERETSKLRIPWRRPSVFPRNSVLAARVALPLADEPVGLALARALFRANFAEDRDLGDEATVTEVLAAVGLDARAEIAGALAPENRGRLRAQTEEAARRGVFGAPTFFVGEELFFGNDRLADALALAARA
jgi:2-hydroxychromene-2-carboxylate isomerase